VNILVTGASGFIGSHLISRLCENQSVYALSRNDSSDNQKFKQIKADLLENNFEAKLPTNIQCVIHLAQSRSYKDFPKAADDIFKVNTEGTCRLLEWSRKQKVKHFIFASTANVYSPSTELLDETSQTFPDSFYGATKLSAETFVRQYNQYFSVDILRLFTVYGPNQKNMLFPTVIERIKNAQEITIAEGVGIYLTPIYVGDVVDLISILIDKTIQKEMRVVNVCGDKIVSLTEVVKNIEALLNKPACIKFTDDMPKSFIGSNKKLKRLIKEWNFTGLEEGLHLSLSP